MHPRQQPVSRYRGRRRLPKLPSKRYAVVVTTAFFSAGVVALGSGAVLPDLKIPGVTIDDPATQALSVEDRLMSLDRANRSEERPGPAVSVEQGAPDVWLLPCRVEYSVTTLYELRWGAFHFGVDLAAPYGTPFYAANAGVVTVARWYGGYGNGIVIDHGNGVESIYGHASAILVTEGQRVQAGEVIGRVGSTGFSTGNHLHFEVHVNGSPADPLSFMLAHGVDINKRLEAASGGNVIT